MTIPINNQSSTTNAQSSILLLGDKGPFTSLLKAALKGRPDITIHTEPHVLNGIIHLHKKQYNLTFLNAEQTDHKTPSAAAAIKQVAPNVPLILYGQAYTEIFSQPALQSNTADDFLVCPISPAQLKQIIANLSPPAENITIQEPQSPPLHHPDTQHHNLRSQLLHNIHQLTQLIPHGRSIVIQQAEELLCELFQVQWVKICPIDLTHETSSQNNGFYNYQNHHAISLTSPDGPIGHLSLGPKASNQNETSTIEILKKNRSSIHQTGSMIGTLLYLAQRDEHLRHLATIDELTGAYNRRYLEYFIRQVINKSEHEHTEVTLLLFDIDNFKHYNDTYGHASGDDILKQATTLIKRCCREHDIVARFGGDEFAVLFWDTGSQRKPYIPPTGKKQKATTETTSPQNSHSQQVLFMSNRFRRLFRTSEFPSLGPNANETLTISGGLANFPADGQTVTQMLEQADKALFNAKRNGKNRIYLAGRPETPTPAK
ncbi:MAG: GGDEF domain-containing protein [Desulfobulbaceae bacterium]|nr:GGDEF domain-containing protein [Desulfobulbaceae bacterium]